MKFNLDRKLAVSFALVGALSVSAVALADGETVKCEKEEAVVLMPPPAQNCDADRFERAVRAAGCTSSDVWSQRFTRRLQDGEFNNCKQYPGTSLAVLTSARGGDVIVVNKDTCSKITYKADQAGLDEMKVVGGFVYFTSNDGQLYIVDARGRIYEIQSRSGQSYSRARNSAVTSIKGDAHNSRVLHVTLSSGTRFDLTAGEIQASEARYELLAVTQTEGRYFLPPPPADGEAVETALPTSTAGDSEIGEIVFPPPPGGYNDYSFGRAKDIDAPRYYSSASYGDLGDCDGTITVERVSSSVVDISFSARSCSRVDFRGIDGVTYDITKRLDTRYKPYEGTYRVRGNGYINRNKAKIVLHSRSGETGVVYYVHF